MSPEWIGAIAGVVGAVAAIVACFQASAARRAAVEVKVKVDQVNSNLTTLTNSPLFNFRGANMNISGASGGAGGSGSAGGGGGGSTFGEGGAGGHGA